MSYWTQPFPPIFETYSPECEMSIPMIHYSPEINQEMLERMAANAGRITADNMESEIENMRQLAERISEAEIYRYYGERE